MQLRSGTCCKCPEEKGEVMIVKRSPLLGDFCRYHNQIRLNEQKRKAENRTDKRPAKVAKRKSNFIPRKPIKYKRKTTGEWAFFIAQFAVSSKRSFISDIPLIGELQVVWCFHVLGKGAYPKYRLYDKNLVFTTEQEHLDWHSNMTKAQLLKKDSRWQKIFDLYQRLKIEYHNG